VGGAKGGDRGERDSAKHAPHADAGSRVPGAEARTSTAKVRKKERFTALLHHVNPDLLQLSFYALKRNAAPGVDGVTWTTTRQTCRAICGTCIRESIGRVPGATRPAQVHTKPDGRQRPLGYRRSEDKIVQRAVVAVLNAVYEQEFVGFSYGFRPKRSAHDALDALIVGINRKRVNWVLDLRRPGLLRDGQP